MNPACGLSYPLKLHEDINILVLVYRLYSIQLRFTPSQSNTCVAIAVETVGVAFVGVFVFKKRADLDDSGNY